MPPTEPTGRDVGPFRGVTTVRVHGAFEICRGADDEGRAVTILTMGPSAAEDRALRAVFTEAYEWARATGPGPDEFVGAELTADQPWIASLDSPTAPGVRRLFDRLVSAVRPPAPGRHTGNIPKITDTGPIPRVPAGPAPRSGPAGRPPGPPHGRPPVRAAGPHTGQIPRIAEAPTAQHPRVEPPTHHTGQLPRPHQTGQLPRTHQTGQLPRTQQTGPLPTHQTGPLPTHQTGQLPRIEPTGHRPAMPPYQGPAYTAAPRPIAPANAAPRRRPTSGGRVLPVVLVLVAVAAVGVLAMLVGILVAVAR
ncbi:hypothetical protein [Actinocatenispora rupis]|uniref:Uncharacterized protein n=1 Tax=Actinocatenispora rupis TaxID=519421 RepID=A0A8J3JCJ7_9ACTN|nr:hypothetical protein [Actinocatenispora rupis]GID14007.1 hypothetical protein Aru02nite_48960 [Actinocatenispora rupis]